MENINDIIKRNHIPSLYDMNDVSLFFRFGNLAVLDIYIGKELVDSLSSIISDDFKTLNISSKELFHRLYPGGRIDDEGKLSKLYHSPYSPNHVIAGDLVLLLNDKLSDVCLYMGKGRYLVFEDDNKRFLAVKSYQLGYLYPNQKKCILRNLDIIYDKDFSIFYSQFIATGKSQITTNKLVLNSYGFIGTQRLYDSYVRELYSIYKSFDKDKALSIIEKLNDRVVIKHIGGNYYLHQNRNSRSFYRDANYSLSIVDHDTDDGLEVAIVSFFPDGRDIEIVQIGGNNHYGEDFLKLWTIVIDFMKEYFSQMGFENIKILRGDKNINYIHPKQRTLQSSFDLQKHQEILMLRYNVSPHRKRGFTKPDQWYSYFNLNNYHANRKD